MDAFGNWIDTVPPALKKRPGKSRHVQGNNPPWFQTLKESTLLRYSWGIFDEFWIDKGRRRLLTRRVSNISVHCPAKLAVE